MKEDEIFVQGLEHLHQQLIALMDQYGLCKKLSSDGPTNIREQGAVESWLRDVCGSITTHLAHLFLRHRRPPVADQSPPEGL